MNDSIHRLKYRRQFLACSKKLTVEDDWKSVLLPEESFFIYSHPDLDLTHSFDKKSGGKLVLLGFIIDPHHSDRGNQAILDDILSMSSNFGEVVEFASKLAGRFVLIASFQHQIYVMHDMCGLRTVYYAYTEGNIFLASQPRLFADHFELKQSENYNTFKNSEHYKKDIEHWLPCGLTIYKDVQQLIPNHYLSVQQKKQIRYWPVSNLMEQNLEDAVVISANLIKNMIVAIDKRYEIALPISAGLDSRLLLAASQDLVEDFYLYTWRFDRTPKASPDIRIPKSISWKLKIPHHVIDCRQEPEDWFKELYFANAVLPHKDWLKITYGMYTQYPVNRVVLNGNIAELARCSLYKEGVHEEVTSAKQLPVDWPEWYEMPFIMDYLEEWLTNNKPLCTEMKIDIFDLWYMEIFMGGWLAQSMTEFDMVYEKFSPYNYRPLAEIMLGVPVKYRLHDHPELNRKIIDYFWPDLLYWPVNPAKWNWKFKLKYYIADKLRNTKLFPVGLFIYRKIHPLYMKLKISS